MFFAAAILEINYTKIRYLSRVTGCLAICCRGERKISIGSLLYQKTIQYLNLDNDEVTLVVFTGQPFKLIGEKVSFFWALIKILIELNAKHTKPPDPVIYLAIVMTN